MGDYYNDPMMPVARRLLEAGSDRDRAAMLLRLPDAIMASEADALSEACRTAGFHHGVSFVEMRANALHRVRDAHGLLPEPVAVELEAYRLGLSKYVAGDSL